ncbi:MAG: GerMN domain-containing protein, partial [Firmicutes bacterium]|nr:GerMN domain-containing protein [Bacillota bacterium]
MRKTICVITACIMMITMISGCGALEKLGLKDTENDELRPVSSIVMNEDEARKLSDKVPVRLYFANEDNSKLLAEIRYIPMSEAKKSVNSLASSIVKELIKGPMSNAGMKATIPKSTKLRSPININAGIATVDLTKEFVDNHPGGKEAEKMTIYSIVNSLTELKEIQKVR